MQTSKFCGVVGAVLLLCSLSLGDTLTFVPQSMPGGDSDWFNSLNWYASDGSGNLSPAGRLPLSDEDAVITGMADAGSGGGIRLDALILTNNAVVANGRFALINLQMLGGSALSNCAANVLTSMAVGGTNCVLDETVINIFATASAVFAPIGTAPAAGLTLTRASTFQNAGFVRLADGTQVNGGGAPQSQFIVLSGATVSSTNQVLFQGPATNHLVIDNSGLVRCEGGSLNFGDGLDWISSAGAGEFQASSTNALVLFTAPFHADAPVTDSFTGAGTNRWFAGATLDGTAQVLGNLEVLDSVSGAGVIHVANNGSSAGTVSWMNGALGVPQVNVDSGANLLLRGNPNQSRQLLGCALNNSGLCRVLTGGLNFGQSATINNLSGGVFELDADGAFSLAAVNGSGAINNAGIFRKLSSGVTQFGTSGSVTGPDFNNSGLLDLQSGQLNVLSGASSGEFRTGTGAALWFWGGVHTLNSGATFTGAGSVRLSQGLAAAKWLVNAPLTVSGLELGSNGTVDGSGNASGSPIHFGMLLAADNGTLSNGKFEALSCQMLDRSIVTNSTLNVLGGLTVSGTNCTLAAATLEIRPGAVATLDASNSTAPAVLSLGQGSVLEDDGLITLLNNGQITATMAPQSRILVSPGAVLNTTNLATIQGSATNHLIVDNSGTVRADAGTFQFGAGLDWKSTLAGGEFQAVTPAALVTFADSFHVDPGVTNIFTGPGTNRWTAGATVEGTAQAGKVDSVSQATVPGNLEILDTVSGAGALRAAGNSGPGGVVTWLNGTLSLPQVYVSQGGTVLIAAGGAGTTRHFSGSHLNNSGRCIWLGGVIAGTGAIFDNSGGGTLDIQADTALTFDNVSPMPALNNAGTFLKSGGNGITDLAADFKNTGNFEVQAGTLSFDGFWVQNVGSTIVDGGAVLATATMNILGGRLSGTGTINAAVNNSSVVSPGASPGILTIAAGRDYQQGAVGTLTIEIGGRSAGTEYDRLAVGGNASLAGRLQVSLINGFTPQIGDSFEVLTCTNEAGVFANIDPTGIPGTVWLPRYNGTNVLLVLTPKLVLSTPILSGNSMSLSFATAAGLSYLVQFSDTLSPPNWQPLKSVTGDGTVQTVTDSTTAPQRFYRLTVE